MDFQSLQKLRFFLAIVFPVVGRNLLTPEQAEEWLNRHPRLKSQLMHLRDSRVGANLLRLNEIFGTGSLGAERFDWSLIPAEAIAVLRAGIILAAFVCVLVPVAMMMPWPALSQEAITGAAGDAVAGWSVVLWMLAVAVTWGFLLAGTATANRMAFLLAIPVFIYFTGAMTASLPRSWLNLALTFGAAVAVVLCEARSVAVQTTSMWRGIITCVLSGMITGFVMIAATPASRWVPGWALPAGLTVGVPLGVGLWWCGRRLARHTAEGGAMPFFLRLDVTVAILAALHLFLTASLAVRGGIIIPAQSLHQLAVQITGYLWPFYYFVGIGVVFKILSETKVVHIAVRELVPARIFVPVATVLLLAATVAAWSDSLVMWLISQGSSVLIAVAGTLHTATARIWSQPLWALTLEWFRWALLVISALTVWNALRRRLDVGRMAALLFPTLLLGLGTYEYFFEFSGFARSPTHTAASLLTFAIFGLWMAHTTLRPILTGESPWWPRPARIALYCAGLMFVLLPVHIRAAIHDRMLSNEIFLYLFFGIIDLGMPYYLFVYADRRFRQMPFSAPVILGIFGIGAALSVPFTILDKLAAAGWSFGAVWTTVNAQVDALLQGAPSHVFIHFLPPAWIVIRGFLAMGAVLVVGVIVRRRMRDSELAPAATVFAVIATATGLACFANRSLDLPLLPLRIVQLITPITVSREIDVAVIARYLSFVIPAFMISLALTGRSGRFIRVTVISAAILVNVITAILWPAHEPWLRSNGILPMAGIAGMVVFLLLIVAVRNRLDAILALRENVYADSPIISWKAFRAASLALILALALISAWRIPAGCMTPREIGKTAAVVMLPAFWHDKTTVAETSGPRLFVASTGEPFPPRLIVEVRQCETNDMRTLLKTVGLEISHGLKGFAPKKLITWDQFHPGALALDFEFEARVASTTFPAIGSIVIAPMQPGTAVIFTMISTLGDRDRQWDLSRALQAMP